MALPAALSILLYVVLIRMLERNIPTIITLIESVVNPAGRKRVQLAKELSEMRKELATISAHDEFARHAKLQRKMNKVEDEMKSLASFASTTISMAVKKVAPQVLKVCLNLVLILAYREELVAYIPDSFFGDLTFPIGGLFWVVICRRITSLVF